MDNYYNLKSSIILQSSSMMNIKLLTSDYIEDILRLQTIAINNGDPFTPSSREMYQRAFMYQNFVHGVFEDNELIGYCNCSIPTKNSSMNLGRNVLHDDELDSVGHVNTILVDVPYRRKGYGGRLLESVINHFLVVPQIRYVFTTIQTINEPSYKLFLKHQFITLKTFNNKGKQKYLLERMII